jgi:hypothetical protein
MTSSRNSASVSDSRYLSALSCRVMNKEDNPFLPANR